MAERLRRYVQVVVDFVGVGSIPTGCIFCVRDVINAAFTRDFSLKIKIRNQSVLSLGAMVDSD